MDRSAQQDHLLAVQAVFAANQAAEPARAAPAAGPPPTSPGADPPVPAAPPARAPSAGEATDGGGSSPQAAFLGDSHDSTPGRQAAASDSPGRTELPLALEEGDGRIHVLAFDLAAAEVAIQHFLDRLDSLDAGPTAAQAGRELGPWLVVATATTALELARRQLGKPSAWRLVAAGGWGRSTRSWFSGLADSAPEEEG